MKNLFTYIIGSDSQFTLQHRVCNALMFVSILFGIQAGVSNYLLGFSMITVYVSFIATIILSFLYYISRFKNMKDVAVRTSLILSAVTLVPYMWIGNAGSHGGMIFYLFLYGAFAMAVIEKHKGFFYVLLYLVVSIIMFVLEYANIVQTLSHHSPLDRLIDILIAFVFVMAGISTTIYIFKKQYEITNSKLDEKNTFLNQILEEVKSQNEEISSQRDKLINQNKIITQQNLDITDSISYAEKIQTAVLPNSIKLSDILNNFFIIYKPKDIVSGDFYWTSYFDERIIVAVSDCTGHGVPGGFMSMLGISFLNEIVNHQKIYKPAEILTNLRKYIIDALNQKGSIGEQSDGMDISICLIDKKKNTIEYAGANSPIFIVSEKPPSFSDNSRIRIYECANSKIKEKLYHIVPDKMPISYFVKMKDFESLTIQLNKNDLIYMFSDGYADQFGGPKARKMRITNFKKYILHSLNPDMNIQKKALIENLRKWKKNNVQIDDITVLGIKI